MTLRISRDDQRRARPSLAGHHRPRAITRGDFGDHAVERLDSGTDFGVGTTWRETRVMFGREATEVMEIVAVDEGRSYDGCGGWAGSSLPVDSQREPGGGRQHPHHDLRRRAHRTGRQVSSGPPSADCSLERPAKPSSRIWRTSPPRPREPDFELLDSGGT